MLTYAGQAHKTSPQVLTYAVQAHKTSPQVLTYAGQAHKSSPQVLINLCWSGPVRLEAWRILINPQCSKIDTCTYYEGLQTNCACY